MTKIPPVRMVILTPSSTTMSTNFIMKSSLRSREALSFISSQPRRTLQSHSMRTPRAFSSQALRRPHVQARLANIERPVCEESGFCFVPKSSQRLTRHSQNSFHTDRQNRSLLCELSVHQRKCAWLLTARQPYLRTSMLREWVSRLMAKTRNTQLYCCEICVRAQNVFMSLLPNDCTPQPTSPPTFGQRPSLSLSRIQPRSRSLGRTTHLDSMRHTRLTSALMGFETSTGLERCQGRFKILWSRSLSGAQRIIMFRIPSLATT